jgi:transcriptional regulator with XRE-family HTH domain
MDDLPNRIRTYREQHGLTAAQFVRLLDADNMPAPMMVYYWEREDKRTVPSPPVLAKLAALGVITIAERDRLTYGTDAA